jgi:hypothetical protein
LARNLARRSSATAGWSMGTMCPALNTRMNAKFRNERTTPASISLSVR